MLQLRGEKVFFFLLKNQYFINAATWICHLKTIKKTLRFTLKTLEDSKIKIQIKCVWQKSAQLPSMELFL